MATDALTLEWATDVGKRRYAVEKNDSDVGTWESVGEFELDPPESNTDNTFFILAWMLFGTTDFNYGSLTGTRFNGGGIATMYTDIDPVETGRTISLRWTTEGIEDSFLDFFADIEGGNFELAILNWTSDASTAFVSYLDWRSDVEVTPVATLSWAIDVEMSAGSEAAALGGLSWVSDVGGIESSAELQFFSDVGGVVAAIIQWFNTARLRGDPIGNALVLVYNHEVGNALDIPAEFGAPVAQQLVISDPLTEELVGVLEIPASLGLPIQGQLVLVLGLTEPIAQALEIPSLLVDSVAQQLEVKYEIQNFDVLAQALDFAYTLMGPTTVQADPNVFLYVGDNQQLSVASANVNMDEGQYAWTCQVELANALYYNLFGPNEPFSLDLNGEIYNFLLDSKALSRGSQVDIRVTLNGVSPTAIHAAPRAPKITKTWDTPMLASQIVQEVLNDVNTIWEIIDWSIPAFRLGVQNATPMEVVQLIAKAAGALVESDPDGMLRVRYRFPVSPPDYDSVSPDQAYTDEEHTFSLTENSTPVVIVNKLRIMDVVAGAAQDSVEFEADEGDPSQGILKVWPKPWRDTFTVTHTSNSQVSVTPLGIFTEQLTEVIEILGGKGRTAKPIYQLDTFEWLFKDLGGVVFEPNSNEFTTDDPVNKESLARVTYTTRFFQFKVVAYTGAIVQFLIGDPE